MHPAHVTCFLPTHRPFHRTDIPLRPSLVLHTLISICLRMSPRNLDHDFEATASLPPPNTNHILPKLRISVPPSSCTHTHPCVSAVLRARMSPCKHICAAFPPFSQRCFSRPSSSCVAHGSLCMLCADDNAVELPAFCKRGTCVHAVLCRCCDRRECDGD